MTSMPTKGIYAITPSDNRPIPQLVEQVEQAIAGGIALLQYRDKSASAKRKNTLIPRLLELCRNAKIPLLINDSITLCKQHNADGVHIGQSDVDIDSARAQLGDRAIIGVTCHNSANLALAAVNSGADYIAFGRFFNSVTKPNASAANPTILSNHYTVPVVAIGGITTNNGQQLVHAGANLLAVCSEIFDANDITAACQQLNEAFSNSG